MSKQQEALRLALEALLWANKEINGWRDDAYGHEPEDQPEIMSAITALEEALAQPAQEPVATVTSETGADITMSWWHEPALPIGTKLYTSLPQRTWVGLTDEERQDIALEVPIDAVFITEAKLRSKHDPH